MLNNRSHILFESKMYVLFLIWLVRQSQQIRSFNMTLLIYTNDLLDLFQSDGTQIFIHCSVMFLIQTCIFVFSLLSLKSSLSLLWSSVLQFQLWSSALYRFSVLVQKGQKLWSNKARSLILYFGCVYLSTAQDVHRQHYIVICVSVLQLDIFIINLLIFRCMEPGSDTVYAGGWQSTISRG